MPNLATLALKAFVPARDFDLSKRFYQDMGFVLAWDRGDLAQLQHQNVAFLLQRFHVQAFAENLMFHLLVEDVDAWWNRLDAAGLAERYGVRVSAVEQQPWGERDFVVFDPSGVLWRIGQDSR